MSESNLLFRASLDGFTRGIRTFRGSEKPRIWKCPGTGTWLCYSIPSLGVGRTPLDAYNDWRRKTRPKDFE